MSKSINKISDFNKFGSVLGLERIQELLKRLGNPHKNLKIIHIGGTNGKGSTSRMVYQVLREAGYSVGIYTSPFLEVFNERIELDGKMIPDEYLDKYADQVSDIAREMCDEGLLSPTEFDVVTAIGFMFFAEKNADFVVLEVGLGGTGDSTNVVENPVATAITSISLDHTDRLGTTIEEIARDKAGIVKENVPMICGTHNIEAAKIIEQRAKSMGSPFVDASKFGFEILKSDLTGSKINCLIGDNKLENLEISMIGVHQIENAMVALCILINLKDRDVVAFDKEALYRGMKKASNIGRFEIVGTNPIVIIDGAHNEAGVNAFVNTVKSSLEGKKTAIVMGVLADKDVAKMVEILCQLDADFFTTEPDNPRKMSKEDLKDVFEKSGKNVIGQGSPDEVIHFINTNKDYDAIVVVGSLYLIGEIRRKNNDYGK